MATLSPQPNRALTPGASSTASAKERTVPAYERPLYELFSIIYGQLLALKNNRTKYINSKQVYAIYDRFLDLLNELTITRKDEELKGITLAVPNTNDLVIDDIWQLLSLCFVTCGLIKFAPATYSSLLTVSKLLDHLKECQVYTYDDLSPIKSRLEEIRSIISASEQQQLDDEDDLARAVSHKREESLLLRNKLNRCKQLYNDLEKSFEEIPSDLEPVYSKLVLIRKSLLNYLTSVPDIGLLEAPQDDQLTKKVADLKANLRRIESQRDDEGKFVSAHYLSKTHFQSTQTVMNGLLDDCNNLINDVSFQKDKSALTSLFGSLSLDNANVRDFRSLYDQLVTVKLTLENLLVTRRWTMRETDLYNYQKLLKELDDRRIALIKTSKPAPENKSVKRLQILILYLLRRCYSLIYKLLESSEPVSESLQPIHNQLSTVRKCLLEIKRVDGLNNLRELYPFQFKLASLDNLRSDGKFIINNQIPEGQGTLNTLLAECFDIIHELKIELEEKEEEDELRLGQPADLKGNITDDEDIKSDDEVEMKRKRYVGFHEADYDLESESAFEDDFDSVVSLSGSEYAGNDYY